MLQKPHVDKPRIIGPRWVPPRVTFTPLPRIYWGSFTPPRFYRGNFMMPRFHMPRFRRPSFRLPKVTLPTFRMFRIDSSGISGGFTKGGVAKGAVYGAGVDGVGAAVPGVKAPSYALPAFNMPWLSWLLVAIVALWLGAAYGSSRVGAASVPKGPFCQGNEIPRFVGGLATLKARVGPVMGDPAECSHQNPENSDVLQKTTSGQAYYRASTKMYVFTDGWKHYGLQPDGKIVTWESPSPDPPPAS